MAPAMNTNMLEHEAVQRNIAALAARGVRFVDPGDGYLACGWIGKGRLAEPQAIADAAHNLLRPRGSLLGRLVLVTAGPTYEDIDPVRYVGNRSSGKMGYSVAAEAARRGARVVLISGPSHETPPAGVELVRVRGAIEMRDAVQRHAAEADAVVMAAAVADYMPENGGASSKMREGGPPDAAQLVRTPDILAGARARPRFVVPPRPGRLRRRERRPDRARTREADAQAVDLIVANDISRPAPGSIPSQRGDDHRPDGEEPVPLHPRPAGRADRRSVGAAPLRGASALIPATVDPKKSTDRRSSPFLRGTRRRRASAVTPPGAAAPVDVPPHRLNCRRRSPDRPSSRPRPPIS